MKKRAGKACVVPVAVVAGLGMAGMGLLSDGIVKATDVTSVQDTINVGVLPTCTFNNVASETYAGSAANGTEVENFNNSGVHTFYLFCNNNDGYTVSAEPYDLEATNTEDVIAYTDNYTASGQDGLWTAEITTSEPGVVVTNPVPVGGGVIISSNTNSSANMSFTATYSAYVGSLTPAGTYTGTIVYTLTASGTSNSGDSEHADTNDSENSNDDSNSGNEVTDNSGSGDNSGDASNTLSNTSNASPLSLNNFYNTYNTTNTSNTYNTTNYSGEGVSAPVATSGQLASGDANDTANNDDTANDGGSSSNVGASNSYEKPLGVTSTTSSSAEKEVGMDPMPIVATGALAVAGVAGIALARSGKKEEE